MPSQQLQNIAEMIRANRPETLPPIEQQRQAFDMTTAFFPPPDDVAFEEVDAGGVPAEWTTPAGVGQIKVLFYLHGGGYVVGSPKTHRNLVARLAAAAGIRALSVEYRLAPEHPHPAAVDDAVTAYRWMLRQGVDPSRVAIAGDSAGGGLTFATLVALRDAGDPLPACTFTMSPWTDLEGTGDSVKTRADADPMIDPLRLKEIGLLYAGDHDIRAPLVSPLHADLRGLPPTLIHVGDAEVLLDDSTRIAERLRDAGVEVGLSAPEEMIHVWHFFAGSVPESDEAVAEAGAWIRDRLA